MINKLPKYLNDLEEKISKHAVSNPEISKSTVGWQIEHILLTINAIIENIEKSDPQNYRWRFSLSKTMVFALNKIPRGRAKSPKVVTPEHYDEQTLAHHLQFTKTKIRQLENLDPNKYFNHPFFGDLKLKKAVKFLEIHTNHHMEIINDILKSK